MTLKEWSLLILLAAIWGSSFPFTKAAVTEITPMTLIFSRMFIASLFLLLILLITRQRFPLGVKRWGTFFVMAFLNSVLPFNLIAWGLQYIDSSLGSILNATTPIFSVILVHLLTREDQLTGNRISGVVVGWIGILVLFGAGSFNSSDNSLWGRLAILGAAVSYALGAIYSRNKIKDIPQISATAGIIIAASIISGAGALVFEDPIHLHPGFSSITSAVSLGILCTGSAYLIYYRLLASTGSTNVLLVTFLIPFSSTLLSIGFLGERLSLNTVSGALLLFSGLLIIDGRLLKSRRKP